MSDVLLSPENRALAAEMALRVVTEEKIALQDAAWDLLSALEGGDIDQINKAKRRLGLVFLDVS
jgi:hypothetical protein